MTPDEEAIARVLKAYENALNTADTEAVMSLYAGDGVFMPQHSPSSVGAEAVRRAYVAVFEAIRLSVTFNIAEIRQIAPDWAFARTNSEGMATVNATGESGPEANQELFIFQRSANQWKIARYGFSTTNPPRA
jgi:uncharacterized protein (TIGR02246 family)